MPGNAFGIALLRAREASRYPHMEDFSNAAGCSVSGYRKYERGERVPTKEMLTRILARTHVPQKTRDDLWILWNKALADRVGLSTTDTPPTDIGVLTRKIMNDVDLVLRQSGVDLRRNTKDVCARRIEIRLRNTLEPK